jgi:hypothetical protein
VDGAANKTTQSKRFPRQKVFIVTERYAGIKNLSEIFADLLYSAYQKQQPEVTGKELKANGRISDRAGV